MKNGVNTAITKNYSISILRVVGMFSIVFCHFFSWLGFSFLSQFLNFGVYLFLFISGFLYANKKYSRTEKLVFNTVEENISSILYFCNPHCTFVFFVDRF